MGLHELRDWWHVFLSSPITLRPRDFIHARQRHYCQSQRRGPTSTRLIFRPVMRPVTAIMAIIFDSQVCEKKRPASLSLLSPLLRLDGAMILLLAARDWWKHSHDRSSPGRSARLDIARDFYESKRTRKNAADVARRHYFSGLCDIHLSEDATSRALFDYCTTFSLRRYYHTTKFYFYDDAFS